MESLNDKKGESSMCAETTKEKPTGNIELSTDYRCKVKILNSYPGIRLTKALVYFYYNHSSEHGSTDPASGEPREIDIPHGEATYFFSRNSNDCVTKVETFVVTDRAGYTNGSSDEAPRGSCWTEQNFEILRGFIGAVDKVPTNALTKFVSLGEGKVVKVGDNTIIIFNGHGII